MLLQRAGSVIDALSVMEQALLINSADATKLTGTEFSDFRGCGRHRHRRRYSSDGAQKSPLVCRGDFGGLKSSAES